MNQTHRIRVKLITLAGLVSLSAALWVVVLTPPASGYEISIYDAYPWPVWILIAASTLTLFCSLLCGECATRRDMGTFIPAAFTSITSVMVLLLIPYFRGYALYAAGDTLTHLGYVADSLQSGHVSGGNVYPAIHVLIAALAQTTSVTPIQLTFFLPPMFVSILLLGTFVLSRHLGSNKTALTALALLAIPVLGFEASRESILPSFDAFCVMPLALYLLFRRQSLSYAVPFIMVLGLLALFHSEADVFLLGFLVAVLMVSRYVSRHAGNIMVDSTMFDVSGSARRKYLMAMILLAVVSIAWFSSLVAFGSTVKSIIGALTSNLFEGPIATRTAYQPTGVFDTSFFLFRAYGAAIVYMGLATGAALVLMTRVLTKRRGVTAAELLLSTMLIESLVLSFIFLLYGLVVGFSVTRILKYPLFASALLLGFRFAARLSPGSSRTPLRADRPSVSHSPSKGIANKSKTVSVARFTVSMLVATAAVVTVLNTYPNLATHGYNYQLTEMDFSAMSFFFSFRNRAYPIDEVVPRSYQTRFAQELYGPDATVPGVRNGYGPEVLPPPHFGYDESRFLGVAYSENTYLLLPSLARVYYPDLYPGVQQSWRYSPSDFDALNRDPTVNRIFDDGGMQIVELMPSA